MEVIHSEAATAFATVKGPTGPDSAEEAGKEAGKRAKAPADGSASPYGALDLESFSKPK
jgi:hypothetical protein